jgi:hypothetical protein
MNFKRASKYHKVSDCGKYSVCVVFIADFKGYEAWRGKVFLKRFNDAESAEKCCLLHAGAVR